MSIPAHGEGVLPMPSDVTKEQFGEALGIVMLFVHENLGGAIKGIMCYEHATGREQFHVDIHNIKLCGAPEDPNLYANSPFSGSASKH